MCNSGCPVLSVQGSAFQGRNAWGLLTLLAGRGSYSLFSSFLHQLVQLWRPSAMPVKYILVKPLAVHIISQLLNWQYTAVTFFPFLGVSNSLTLQFVMIFLAEGQWPFFAFMKFLTSPAFMNEYNQRRICHQTYMFWVNFSGEYVSAGGMGPLDSEGTKNVRNFNISPLRCTRNPSIDSNTNMKL